MKNGFWPNIIRYSEDSNTREYISVCEVAVPPLKINNLKRNALYIGEAGMNFKSNTSGLCIW